MHKTQVLVVGAGPVGAVAAYRLAQAGIQTILVDSNHECPEDMRASTLHAPTLEMMAELGILPELEAMGIRAPRYQYRNRRSGNVIELDLGEVADVLAYPYRLQCEQFKLARLLTGRLAQHPCSSMRFGHRLQQIAQDASTVTATLTTSEGPVTISADYLIAADGANSTVRKLVGTTFEGFTYPERFLTLSTDYPIEQVLPGIAGVNYVAEAEEWYVLLRVPTLWRLLVPTDPAQSDEDLLSDKRKTEVFRGLLGVDDLVTTYHRTVYRVHQRVAERFRHGRVVLAGDAAHLNNPLGGFGMNSGVHDAWNLTSKLRHILQNGGQADALLDRYDRQRRAVAHEFVQAQTIQNKTALGSTRSDGRSDIEHRLEALSQDLAGRRTYLLNQSMYHSLQREAEIQ